ncbi:MAG: putative Ig domain-containing protein [Thermoflexales bacterium]|nr:putative Ig domain-containing protein [Thermoflexales bacterium]
MRKVALISSLMVIIACTTYVIQASPWPDDMLIQAAGPTPSPHNTAADNPISPTQAVKLIFIHHSTGGNWLADPNGEQSYGGLGRALMDNNYFVSATNYGWGPDEIGSTTDIGHWWNWFRGDNTSAVMTALYAENRQNFCNPIADPPYECFGAWPRLPTDPGGPNEVVMFKGCFPNAHLSGNAGDDPTTGDNPLRGQSAWNWDDVQGKSVPNTYHTVANAKGIYNDILQYFAEHQDKLFVVVTGPPLLADDMGFPTDAAHAANYRAFNDWLVNDWLDTYPHKNVAVFDYYNVLTSNGGDPETNDAGQEAGNHHRWWNNAVQHVSPVENDLAAYAMWLDSHPTTAGQQKATTEFVQMLNVFYNRWKSGATPTPSLTLVSPNGGENWPVNSPHPIQWTSAGAIANVRLAYSTDGFTTSHTIVASVANTGIYTWTTPITPSTSMRVRVASVVSPTIYGDSQADFSVYQSGSKDKFIYLPVVLKNDTAAPPACAVPLTGVTINGQTSGLTNTAYTFTAAPTPANASTPIAYTWLPAPQSGQGTASATYQWPTTGSQTIQVTASNCSGVHTANDDHAITIQAQTPHASGALIQPMDFVYLGAFRLPNETAGDVSWSYGGYGMSYYPNGDAGNTDAYPGSLFSISDYPNNNYVSEFSIPVPLISAGKNLGDLPTATTLQPFADITGGRQISGLQDSLTVVDIQYYPRQGAQTSDKLYWVMFEYYMPEDEIGHGWSELTLATPQAQGAWRLGDFPTSGANKYLFEIPTAWADAYTPGRYLAAGRNRIPNDGSWGPALYAFGPWNDGNPPANGSSVTATQMLYYPFDYDNYFIDHMIRDYSHADEWDDGAWLTVGERSAVMFAGIKSLRREYELEYYGEDNVDACGNSKGWHAEPYYAAVLFYDPAMLAAAVQGEIAPYEIQPYAMLNLEDYMFQQGCRRQILGGVGYDRQRGLVYVLEKEVMDDDAKPIVHVFQLSATPQAADLTPPTAPTNVQAAATSTRVDLSWNAASDNAHLAGYIIYRFGEPVATTPATTYSDNKVNPGTAYTYTVVAWDASNKLSAPATVVAATPAGSDSRIPIVYGIEYSGLSDTGITVRWRTDEPATTVITYELQYSGDMRVYQDNTLTRQHQAVLTGLTPDNAYDVWWVAGADAGGRANVFPIENWSFHTPPAGETWNFRPILNGIGSRRVAVGDTVVCTLDALDQDADDTLTFSAENLPAGATFTPATRRFSWTPSAAGTYRITFSVSDGDQTDSERVTIFVTASTSSSMR